jgi:hypothetical protein
VLEKVRGIQEQAEREGRELTAAERAEVKGLIDRARDASEVEAQIPALQSNLDGDGYRHYQRNPTWGDLAVGAGLGDQFIASQGYTAIAHPASRGRSWTTGAADRRLRAPP